MTARPRPIAGWNCCSATLEGAASGLRREWDLVGGGPSPADVVAARLPAPTVAGERTADPARLLAWVGLPGAHLIVDGYNVSKTGFADLSLSDQRDRLIRLLAALAARTSAEVTVVFDGATVAAARPPGRGIRVLFSAAGVLADDVIKDLVRAEPQGRVVIVVSSDRQVAETASRDGARTAHRPCSSLRSAAGVRFQSDCRCRDLAFAMWSTPNARPEGRACRCTSIVIIARSRALPVAGVW